MRERRGGRQHWHHNGYRVTPGDPAHLRVSIEQCRDRFNRKCQCAIHHRFGGIDLVGVLSNMQSFEIKNAAAPSV